MTNTEKYFVAFIDILGFSELVKKYDNGMLPDVLDDLKYALNNATSLLKMNLSGEEEAINWKKGLKVHLFSDCLCAAIPYSLNFSDVFQNFVFFCMYISSYQNLLMDKGFFARGGISSGSFYSDENMIFSGALVESVELEKTAIFPRILVSKNLLKEMGSWRDLEIEIIESLLVKDQDNLIFINNFNIADVTNLIFKNNFEKIKKDNPSFARGLEQQMKFREDFEVSENLKFRKLVKTRIRKCLIQYGSDQKLFLKYFWLKRYFDWTEHCLDNKMKFEKLDIIEVVKKKQ